MSPQDRKRRADELVSILAELKADFSCDPNVDKNLLACINAQLDSAREINTAIAGLLPCWTAKPRTV